MSELADDEEIDSPRAAFSEAVNSLYPWIEKCVQIYAPTRFASFSAEAQEWNDYSQSRGPRRCRLDRAARALDFHVREASEQFAAIALNFLAAEAALCRLVEHPKTPGVGFLEQVEKHHATLQRVRSALLHMMEREEEFVSEAERIATALWNRETKPLAEIFRIKKDADFIWELKRFVYDKATSRPAALTECERTLGLIGRLGSAIAGEGWDSVFMQTYTYSELQKIMDTFREIGATSFAERLEKSRHIYYLGRTDLERPDSLFVGNNVFAHVPDAGLDQLDKLGEGVCDGEPSEFARLYPRLAKWCRKNRVEFVE